jgi:hypothetical protein
MQNAFSALPGPILVLWIGALVFYVLDRLLEPQDAGVAEAVTLTLATGMLFLGRARVGAAFGFGQALAQVGWTGNSPGLPMETAQRYLALILMCTATAASLASLGQAVLGRAGRMAILGTTLLLLFAEDWATLALAWMLMNLALLFTPSSDNEVEGSPGNEPNARRWLAFMSLGGAVLLGTSLTLWRLSGNDLGGTTSPPWPVAGLAMAAAVLRLMPWPLPSWTDTQERGIDTRTTLHPRTPSARIVPFVASIVSGSYLWARLGESLSEANESRWWAALSLWAALALLVSALKAWSAQEPQRLITRTAPYGVAFSLLAAGLGLPAQWQLLVGAGTVLTVCALTIGWTQCQYLDLTDPRSYWRVAPTGLALLSLAGLPLTVGFPARAAIYSRAFADGRWLVLLITLVGEAGMLGALLRIVLDVECVIELDADPDPEGEHKVPGASPLFMQTWLHNLAYGGSAVLALGIIVVGTVPGLLGVQGLSFWFRLPRLQVWAALLLPAIGAIALYRSHEGLVLWLDEWWPVIRRLFDLRWATRALEQGARWLGTIIWGGSQVVEGAGYMAWVVLFCLVVFLFVRSR